MEQYYLGYMYYEGKGVEQDYLKAFEWYEKSVKQGYADAQYNLAVMYANGHGVEQDNNKAFEWYLKSAEQGKLLARSIIWQRKECSFCENCKARTW